MMDISSWLQPHWNQPVYRFRNEAGKTIWIDVTTSVSPGLPPNHILIDKVIPFLKKHNVEKILDFGAGSLRHSIPLIKAGFTVGAVDFKDNYKRPACKEALNSLCANERFCLMEWPHYYCGNPNIFKGKFDAALMIYVLQTMPKPGERRDALRYISRKLKKRDTYLFYSSRSNQLDGHHKKYRVSDGYYMYPARKYHSFYREFSTTETHELMAHYKFERIRSFSERGTDQMFMYYRWSFP